MKKIALALVLVTMTAGAAMAQVTYGAKVGFDMTNFWGKNTEHGMQPNYQAGLFLEYKATENFAIAPEVVFASQGGKYSEDLLGSTIDYTYATNYINVPVMLKFYPTENFSIDLGPQVGFNVYSKVTGKTNAGGVKVKEKVDLKDDTKTVDFGVGLGATYNLSANAFVQARYTMGLTKVFDGSDAKNSNIQLAFGYRF